MSVCGAKQCTGHQKPYSVEQAHSEQTAEDNHMNVQLLSAVHCCATVATSPFILTLTVLIISNDQKHYINIYASQTPEQDT